MSSTPRRLHELALDVAGGQVADALGGELLASALRGDPMYCRDDIGARLE